MAFSLEELPHSPNVFLVALPKTAEFLDNPNSYSGWSIEYGDTACICARTQIDRSIQLLMEQYSLCDNILNKSNKHKDKLPRNSKRFTHNWQYGIRSNVSLHRHHAVTEYVLVFTHWAMFSTTLSISNIEKNIFISNRLLYENITSANLI